ncbi:MULTISPECIES: hypothetical protein [Streptomyces]|uniref:Uncharacterized protein n=2 Tax=Streptomyces TaxID=1883 RepID=A0A3R7I537_9ACTN|nr:MULTISPECIES: hypothetical protein [Streptomyces]KNE83464.1 hypothetical protein ADZ36_05125 [Streptomyces fradiae]OFA61947.1 hypothetical protein BEN35_00495 [Streptomyces fradiae]PQM24269.1 hypothetical protein Sfr7A_05635 [Streptomyces xinghaiensis]RKM97234.1 hypothetical protein SFRA_008325 [Streptomyces xinghaiensis]RNC75371.1 hypothetical protein DC095_006275 [Streptomyces xinghaiensis]
MEAELLALAGTGATTLVGLMVSDSWTHIRQRLTDFFSRTGSLPEPMGELEASRRQVIAARRAGDDLAVADVEAAWRAQLCRILGSDPVASQELRALLVDLVRATSDRASPDTVHNVVSGGVHNAPVVQSGRITGLTIHTSHHEPPSDMPPDTPTGEMGRDEELPG